MAPAIHRNLVFDFPGDEHIGDTFRIDDEAVKRRPIRDHLDFYSESGKSVTTLVLSEIPEEDVELIFSLFKSIQHLTLEKMQILNEDIKGLPTKIVCLKLIKCRIVKPVFKKWLKSMGTELTSVFISESFYAVPLSYEGSLIGLLKYLPNTVRHLKVHEPSKHYLSMSELPGAEYVYVDILHDGDNRALRQSTEQQVQTLVVRLDAVNWDRREVVDEFERLKNLKHLRIINPIPMELMHKLRSLPNLKTLDVFCYEPPKEVNKILMLNDDCLAEIFSKLEEDDWISLLQVHPRFDHVVGNYILPHELVYFNNEYSEMCPKKTGKGILRRMGETVKSLSVNGEDWPAIASHFKSLETLYLEDGWNSEIRKSIPHSIKKLVLDCNLSDSFGSEDEYDEYDEYEDLYDEEYMEYEYDSAEYLRVRSRRRQQQEYSVVELFKKLNPVLTILKLEKDFCPEDLEELHNIRKFTCRGFKAKDMLKFLRQNQKQMEVLKIQFFNEHRRSPKWYAWWDEFEGPEYQPPSSFRLCPLQALKVLNLESINCHIDLKPADFPSLEEIHVSFDYELKPETESHILTCVSKFEKLKTLKVSSSKNSDLKWLYGMKNLVSLEMNFKGEELLNLMKELPKLSKFKNYENCWSFEFEAEVREFLMGANRTLEVYHGGDLVLALP